MKFTGKLPAEQIKAFGRVKYWKGQVTSKGGIKIRLLLSLKPLKESDYSTLQPNKMQGFIYNQLKGTAFESLHDAKGYKYFCFSNIFRPKKNGEGEREFPKTLRENEEWNWIISSPNPEFTRILKNRLFELTKSGEALNIGDSSFTLESIKPFRKFINPPCTIKAATLIAMRIPQYAYAGYGIQSGLPYLWWRSDMDFRAFIKQLEENLFKKYNQYQGTGIKQFPLFENFIFKKETGTEIVQEGKNIPVHGSIWHFPLSGLTGEQKRILEFGIDTGFGEQNTLGFGFVNVVSA